MSIKFDFDEERNPMPDSLKNSSSARNPNFFQGERERAIFPREGCPIQGGSDTMLNFHMLS